MLNYTSIRNNHYRNTFKQSN